MDPTLRWLYSAECKDGGLSAWRTEDGKWHIPYPEVTGYLLPTLIKWGAGDLALRSAKWLLAIQNPDGSWNGLDGVPRPFDTSAIIEGLIGMYTWTGDFEYIEAATKARMWMKKQIHADGYLINSPSFPNPEIYNLRASAIIDNRRELHYWRGRPLNDSQQRAHYLAYALEGALNLNDVTFVRPHLEACATWNHNLMPFYVDPDWFGTHPAYDLCATAQMGILYKRLRMDEDAGRMYRALAGQIEPNGGVWQSPSDKREILWAAKFWLDFKEVMDDG
jgi:hypothetical protein